MKNKIRFASNYGMKPHLLAVNFSGTPEEAKKLLDKFHKLFPKDPRISKVTHARM